MSHTSGNILLHMIFSTQGRRPLIKSDFRDDLFAYLGGILREMQAASLIINAPRITSTCWCEPVPLTPPPKLRAW